MGKLEGKVAIVTGATSGMGRESAKLFAAEGAKVVVTGRNEERAKAVVDDIKAAGNEAIYVIADMANLDDVQKIFDATMEEYGTIHIKLDELIKKAGISKNKLSHKAEMQRSQINHYCNNDITRLDIDVLARICTVLDCQIGDLLEFIPPKKDE